MKDGIMKGQGNSRLLKGHSSIPATYADFRSSLLAGTLLVDLLYNAAGWDVEGTPLNKAALLSGAVADLIGLAGDPTVNDAFDVLAQARLNIENEILSIQTQITDTGEDIAATKTKFGTCGTAASTAAKIVTHGSFSLTVGAHITVTFTNINTAANPTLNIDATGAKAIYCNGAAANNFCIPKTAEFLYDGTYFQLLNPMFPTVNYATCGTAAATTAKVVPLTGFRLGVGCIVGVLFTAANTADAPTLNVESTGAKPVFYDGAAVTSLPLFGLFQYDGTNWVLLNKPSRKKKIALITSSGNWTPPRANMYVDLFILPGGGGGGKGGNGGSSTGAGGGGGGGGGALAEIVTNFLITSTTPIPVVIGAGGTGGTSGAGGAGGISSFGSFSAKVVGLGGAGGSTYGNVGAGGDGGTKGGNGGAGDGTGSASGSGSLSSAGTAGSATATRNSYCNLNDTWYGSSGTGGAGGIYSGVVGTLGSVAIGGGAGGAGGGTGQAGSPGGAATLAGAGGGGGGGGATGGSYAGGNGGQGGAGLVVVAYD